MPPPLLFVGGLAAAWWLERRIPLPLAGPRLQPAVAAAGLAAVILAAGLGAWALRTFLRARTAILPHRPAARLVTTGPYRRTRNPMYLALTLAHLGVGLLLNSAWPSVVLPVVLVALTLAVVRREERYLSSAFGADYEAYRRRVPRWL